MRRSVLVWSESDLQTLFGVSKHVRSGLFLIGLAAWSEDCETFLATGWVNLESHCCRDESVILLIVDVVHLEGSAILNVSVAAKFNAIGFTTECECGVLK